MIGRNLLGRSLTTSGDEPLASSAYLLYGQRFKIYEAQLAEGEGQPGEIIAKTKHMLVVAAGQGALSLLVVQPAGKPKMAIADFLNGLGRKLEVGDFIGR